MKFKYNGTTKVTVNNQQLSNGDTIDLPDNFKNPFFEAVVTKKNRSNFNELNINKSTKKTKAKRRKKS